MVDKLFRIKLCCDEGKDERDNAFVPLLSYLQILLSLETMCQQLHKEIIKIRGRMIDYLRGSVHHFFSNIPREDDTNS